MIHLLVVYILLGIIIGVLIGYIKHYYYIRKKIHYVYDIIQNQKLKNLLKKVFPYYFTGDEE